MHLAVFFFGFTAILGKLISLNEVPLVWHRLWISCVGLLFIPKILKHIRSIDKKQLLRFALIGTLTTIHWVTFYGSIKLGNNASITLACLATSTLFTAFLEPLLTGSKISLVEVFLGLMVIVGITLLTGVGETYYPAIIMGLVSAFFASLFSTLNKKYVKEEKSTAVTFIELFSGLIMLTIIAPFYLDDFKWAMFTPSPDDWIYLLILGLVCTCLAFVISLNALKVLTAFISNLSINLEPVYGIILAAIIFNESSELNQSFYIGTAIILLAVVIYPVLNKLGAVKNSVS